MLAELMVTEMFKAFAFAIRVLVNVILPALFAIALFITRPIMGLLQTMHPQMSVRWMTFFSTVLWTVVGLIIFPLLTDSTQDISGSIGFGLIAGAIWGLCVGSQLAKEWVVMPLAHDPHSGWDIPATALEADIEEGEITMEELWAGGVILGQDVKHQQ